MRPLRSLASVVRVERIELDAVKRRLARAASIEDLRRIAKRRLPAGVFDYIDGGAEAERTLERNTSAFGSIEFRPHVLRDVSAPDPTTSLFGRPLPIPLVLSPTGFTRIADPEGELAVARAARDAGLPYALSTMATRSIEEVAAAGGDGARLWFQVYVWHDRGLVAELLDRAKAAGYEAIVITVDTARLGRRERDVRRGFVLPPKIGLSTFLDGALHPGWTMDLLRHEPITFANVTGRAEGDGSSAVRLADYINAQFDPALSWAEVDWFRAHWDGPIVLKGVQRVDDAKEAVRVGVDAVALSNHGGRQLDGAPPPVELVAPVRDAVADAVALLCDGGVRRGSDIAKAVALGADAAMIGRAYLYGLAAGGQRGVAHALEELRSGLVRTMMLLGATSIASLDRDLITTNRS